MSFFFSELGNPTGNASGVPKVQHFLKEITPKMRGTKRQQNGAFPELGILLVVDEEIAPFTIC